MSRFQQLLRRIYRWLTFPGPIFRGQAPPEEPPQSFTTGPDLIRRIVRAIELNQSVVLSGPRGCGKSHCVDAAIKQAMQEGIIPPNARVFLQGNREIPRDYLLEDEIAFRLVQSNGQTQVVPYRRSAPLFYFARRSPSTGEPDRDKEGRVYCEVTYDKEGRMCSETASITRADPCRRFVLFLDEINRFSDGVLDGLLSVLEERKAVLGGREFTLPVVVCMTMNPPGYDGSARKLSPPLAARIGRTYRLCTPDLDALSDRIIAGKLEVMRDTYTAEKQVWDQEHPNQLRPQFPEVPPAIIRKVSLTTLCLWGDTSSAKTGNEYLTPQTRALLRKVMTHDRVVRRAMKALSTLCQFGPDGRAGADWLTAGIGLAIEEATAMRLPRAVLRVEHLLKTAVESVSHKIYDSFSPASRPDLTARKEQAVATIVRQVFTRTYFDRLVARIVDDDSRLKRPFIGVLRNLDDFSTDFRQAGVVEDEQVDNWHQVANQLRQETTSTAAPDAPPGAAQNTHEQRLLQILEKQKLVVPADPQAQLKAGFGDSRHEILAHKLAKRRGILGDALHTLFSLRLGVVRLPLDEELRASYVIRCLEVERFLEICQRYNTSRRADLLFLVRLLETLWAFRYDRDSPATVLEQIAGEIGNRVVPLQALFALLPELTRAAATVREAEAVRYQRFLRDFERLLRKSTAVAAKST